MEFADRLLALRKQKGLTQQALANASSVHVVQLRRYEAGTAQPTLEVIRRISKALSTSADTLLFEPDERGPSDDLRLQFEAVSAFDAEDRKVAKAVLDGLILKNQAKRLAQSG